MSDQTTIDFEQLLEAPTSPQPMPSEQFPHFLQRTDLQYVTIAIEQFKQRGMLQNRMFDSIVEGLPNGVCVAGGFMTNIMCDEKKATDVDLFFTSKQAMVDLLRMIVGLPEDDQQKSDPLWFWRQYITPNNIALCESIIKDPNKADPWRYIKLEHSKGGLPLQLIKIAWYQDPCHVIDSFDLTIAQFAADNKNVYANPLAYHDLINKRIVLHRMQFPASTMRRVIKYAKKGYYACPGSLVQIASAIQQFTGPDEVSNVVYVD